MNLIENVIAACNGQWYDVLNNYGIEVPKSGKHGACPSCGGSDRFHFDDKGGRGTWHCRKCEPHAGDGLALVSKTLGKSMLDSAKQLAPIVGIQDTGVVDREALKEAKRRAAENKKKADESEKKAAAAGAEKAIAIWKSCVPAPKDQPYMVKKKIFDHGVRVLSEDLINGKHKFKAGDLVVPCAKFDDAGKVRVQSLEFIGDKKQGLYGAKRNGCFYPIGGSKSLAGARRIFLAEGFATACTINQITGVPTVCCFTCGNLKPVADSLAKHFPDTELVICADRDQPTDREIEKARQESRAPMGDGEIKAQKTGLKYLLVPEHDGTDWNDYYAAGHDIVTALATADMSWDQSHDDDHDEPQLPDQPPEHLPAPAKDVDWQAMLLYKSDGLSIQPCVNNAMVLLSYHPDMIGVLGYNEFSKSVDVLKQAPWEPIPSKYPRPINDVDDTRATAWLERLLCKLNIAVVHNAMVSAAHHNPFNPLQEYLNGLTWDGTPRLDMALHYLLGCPDSEYLRAVSRRFLVGSVARALDPGCKMDTMLILEGPQGLKKSTAVEVLYGEDWFADELSDLGSKDAALEVQGRWCIEIAELATLSRAEANKAKEWISRRVDRFRPPYGRNVVSAPRQCVLIGTVNPEGGYLKDATGGRRYWPVVCKEINIDWIKKRRDQIWAEAVVAYRNGERWWFDKDEMHIAQAEQEERYESDPWSEAVLGWLGQKTMVTVSEVMKDCLDLQAAQQNQMSQNRISKILVNEGWERKQKRFNNNRVWVYVKGE